MERFQKKINVLILKFLNIFSLKVDEYGIPLSKRISILKIQYFLMFFILWVLVSYILYLYDVLSLSFLVYLTFVLFFVGFSTMFIYIKIFNFIGTYIFYKSNKQKILDIYSEIITDEELLVTENGLHKNILIHSGKYAIENHMCALFFAKKYNAMGIKSYIESKNNIRFTLLIK